MKSFPILLVLLTACQSHTASPAPAVSEGSYYVGMSRAELERHSWPSIFRTYRHEDGTEIEAQLQYAAIPLLFLRDDRLIGWSSDLPPHEECGLWMRMTPAEVREELAAEPYDVQRFHSTGGEGYTMELWQLEGQSPLLFWRSHVYDEELEQAVLEQDSYLMGTAMGFEEFLH